MALTGHIMSTGAKFKLYVYDIYLVALFWAILCSVLMRKRVDTILRFWFGFYFWPSSATLASSWGRETLLMVPQDSGWVTCSGLAVSKSPSWFTQIPDNLMFYFFISGPTFKFFEEIWAYNLPWCWDLERTFLNSVLSNFLNSIYYLYNIS